jgi:hypothetical protein
MSWSVVLLCVAMAAAALLLIRRLGVNLSLASVLVAFLLLFHGPAYLYYTRVYGPDTDFYDVILTATKGHDILPTLDLALALAFICVCGGILFTDLATGTTVRRWRRALREWSTVPLRADPVARRRFLVAAAVLAVVLLVPFVLIDAQLPKVLEFFTSDLNEWEKIALRREGGGSSFYLYNLALGNVIPFVAFGLLALALAGARGVKAWTAAFFVLVAIGKAATLSKAPLAVFVLQCAIVWVLLRRLTLSWRAVTILGVLATALFILMSWIANPTADELLAVLDFLFYRVFMIVNESLLEYFAAIPAAIPHSWGTQSSWIAALFQSEPKLPTYWLVGEVHRGVMGSTTTVMFVGDAWADFAWAGVVVASFLAGAIARWIDVRLIVARGRSVATVAGLALGHYGLFIAMSTSLATALVTGGLLFVLPLVALVSPRRRRAAAAEPIAPAGPTPTVAAT